MKKRLSLALAIISISVFAACSPTPSQPVLTSNSDLIATMVAETLTAFPSATSLPSLTPTPSSTPSPTSTNTPTPFVLPSIPDGWATYTNYQYGIALAHPNLFNCQQNCGVSFVIPGDSESVVNFAVENTMGGGDAPFDGFSIAVFPNNDNQSFVDYINQIKQLLPEHPMFGGLPINETNVTVGGQLGTMLSVGDSGSIAGVYVPFPNDRRILIISRGEQKPGSFEKTFERILSTFVFIR